MPGDERRAGAVAPPIAAADPLAQARRDREAVERFWRMQSGVPAALFRSGPAAAGAAPHRQQVAAERSRARGGELLHAGRLPAAIAALRRATELAPQDAAAHHLLGQAFLQGLRLGEAAASLQLAVTLDANFADAYQDLAAALDRQNLHPEATAAYREAVRLRPEWAEGHGRLGELLELAGQDEDALECFRRAAAAAPATETGWLNRARVLVAEGNFAEAEAELREAVAAEPHSDLLYKLLADVLAKQGRFEEAIAACDRALALNPLQVPAHLIAVQAKKCSEADRPRLERMLATLEHPSADDEDRVFLHFAIAKILNDWGEYGEAMRHFDIANHLRHRKVNFDRALFAAHIDWLVQRFTGDFFASRADFAIADETPLLIVGMPRSGTTLVEQILSSHPQIAAGGEVSFWTKRAVSWGIASAAYLTPASARKLSEEYCAKLHRIRPDAARVTDKVPFNFFQLGLIHLLLPKARVIHCRRHPVDTCLSMYFTNFKETMEYASDKGDLAFAYQHYARLMAHWRSVLPPDRFLEVDYERLITDREALTRRLIGFADVAWDDACMMPERNPRPVTTASVWQVRQPVYTTSVERWRRYEPWLGELRQLLTTPAASVQSPAPAA
jgi:tetratricopeptide (TPR) repeat protein